MGGWLGEKLGEVEDFVTDPAVIVTVAIAYATGGLTYSSTAGFGFSTSAAVTTAVGATAAMAAGRALTPSVGDMLGYSIDEMAALGNQTQFTSATAVRELVYGTVIKSGVLTQMITTSATKTNSRYTNDGGNEMLHMLICLACHPVARIQKILIDDVDILGGSSSNFISGSGVQFPYGTPSTATTESNNLVGYVEYCAQLGDVRNPPEGATETNSQWRGQVMFYPDSPTYHATQTSTVYAHGIPLLYVICKYDEDRFPNVPKIRAEVKGRRIYDPRMTHTGKLEAHWTGFDNPALCILDFMTDQHYGMGIPYDEIDLSTFITAANICDQDRNSSATFEHRYRCNGIATLNKTPKVILEELLTSCAGFITFSNGKFKMFAGNPTKTSTATITLDDCIGPIKVQPRNSLREQFNTVRASYPDTATGLVKDIEVQTDDYILGQDQRKRNAIALSLPFTDNASDAEYLAQITLWKMRDEVTVQLTTAMNKFDIDVGEVVTLNLPKYGIENKKFECASWEFSATQGAAVNFTFRETSENAFAENPEADVDVEVILRDTGGTVLYSARSLKDDYFGATRWQADKPKHLLFYEHYEAWINAFTSSTVGPPATSDLEPLFSIDDGLAGDYLKITILAGAGLYGAMGGRGGGDWLVGNGAGGVGGTLFQVDDTGNTPILIVNDGKLWAGGGGGGRGGKGGGYTDGTTDTYGTDGGIGQEGMGFFDRAKADEDFNTWENHADNVGYPAQSATGSRTGSGYTITLADGGTGGKSGSWGRDGFQGETGNEAVLTGTISDGYSVLAPTVGAYGGKGGLICATASGITPDRVTVTDRGSMKGRLTYSSVGDVYYDT